MAKKRIRRSVKTEDISRSGPIRHEQLTPEQEARARGTFKRFARFLPDFSFERYEHSFRRDMRPDRELSVWEHVQRRSSNTCGRRVCRTRNWPQPSSDFPWSYGWTG